MSIYIIRHKDSDNCYIGSTKDFKDRKRQHKYNCNNENANNYNLKLYQFMRENGGWDNFDMVKICKCENDMLREMEQYHIDFIKPSLNDYSAKGWNRERILNSQREYNRKRDKVENVRRVNEYRKTSQVWKDKLKEKKTCDICGKTGLKLNWKRHLKSKYHLSRI